MKWPIEHKALLAAFLATLASTIWYASGSPTWWAAPLPEGDSFRNFVLLMLHFFGLVCIGPLVVLRLELRP